MSFASKYAPLIWDDLYTVLIPDAVTMNPDYVKKFGIPVSGVESIDKDMVNHVTTVKIPIIRIMAYFEEGVLVQIPSRQDMLTMHRNIDLYLTEWTEYLKFAINVDEREYKNLLAGLDSMSKLIYNKAYPGEVIADMFTKNKFGLSNPILEYGQHQQQTKEVNKPNYNSITDLLKRRQKASRF